MKLTIERKDLPTLEMFLFQLNFPCHCELQIVCADTKEVFKYKTIKVDDCLTLITL